MNSKTIKEETKQEETKQEETQQEEVQQEAAEQNSNEQTEENAEQTQPEQDEAKEQTEEPTEEVDELTKAKEEAAANFDKYLRLLAEFDNFRKRTTQEKIERYSDGVRGAVEKILPVADNFERAIDAFEDKESAMYEGIALIQKQLLDVLKSLGVEEVPGAGEPFDPNVHSAVMHIEDENFEENIVAEVFQKGYKLGDKVIRPAMVKVAN